MAVIVLSVMVGVILPVALHRWVSSWAFPSLRVRGRLARVSFRLFFGAGGILAAPLISWAFMGRPAFGWACLILLPLLFHWRESVGKRRKEEQLADAALPFLQALLGFTVSGLSFPSALFRLADARNGPFATRLSAHLNRYREGRSLSRCLEQFRDQSSLGYAGKILLLLDKSYQNGLPILPLIETSVVTVANQLRLSRQLRELRRTATAQSLIAAIIPWVVFLALWLAQPEMAARLRDRGDLGWLCLFALGLEAVGIWGVRRVISFF